MPGLWLSMCSSNAKHSMTLFIQTHIPIPTPSTIHSTHFNNTFVKKRQHNVKLTFAFLTNYFSHNQVRFQLSPTDKSPPVNTQPKSTSHKSQQTLPLINHSLIRFEQLHTMKGIFLLALFAIVALLAVTQSAEAECDQESCVHYCYKVAGAHGECAVGSLGETECKCKYCIYKGCRRLCARKRKIAQCQDDTCACL